MEIGVYSRPIRSEVICGDTYVIVEKNECTLVALADGLGHGPEAAAASRAFCDLVREFSGSLPTRIFAEASAAMAKTRGAAASLLRLDRTSQNVVFTGVGNVEMRAVSRDPMHPICTPGIVGRRVRKIQPMSYNTHPGDLFVLFTDGISSRFSLPDFSHLPCQALVEKLLADFGKPHDDAACAAVRL